MPETLLPSGRSVNWQAAHDVPAARHHRRVADKTPEDLEANARIRAHLRQQMEERSIDKAELARRIRADNGNLSRMMNGSRGFSLGAVLRICSALKLTPTRLLEENPPERYWDVEPVPQPRGGRV